VVEILFKKLIFRYIIASAVGWSQTYGLQLVLISLELVLVLTFQYVGHVTDTCFRKIFNVKSKEVVHECETEFGMFPLIDVIDSWKSTFPVKYMYDHSDNLLYQMCKK